MRETVGKDGAALRLAAPQLGQLPQQQQKPLFDPDRVRDRRADRDSARSPKRPLDHGPCDPRERRAVLLPGAEEVALPEELEAAPTFGDNDATADQPVQDQEPEVRVARRSRWLPRSAL